MKCSQKLKKLNLLLKFIKAGKIDLRKIKVDQANQLFSKKIVKLNLFYSPFYWLLKFTWNVKLIKIIKVINFKFQIK